MNNEFIVSLDRKVLYTPVYGEVQEVLGFTEAGLMLRSLKTGKTRLADPTCEYECFKFVYDLNNKEFKDTYEDRQRKYYLDIECRDYMWSLIRKYRALVK